MSEAEAPTREAAIDRELTRLSERKGVWVRTGIQERIALLRNCIDGVLEVSRDWVDESCRHQGLDPGSAMAGELWLSGPLTTIDGLQQTRSALEHDGRPRPQSMRTAATGQQVARVFPRNLIERFVYHNMSAEVWIEPDRPATQGRIYRDKEEGNFSEGGIALVLGAGNISSIGPLDAVSKLFVEDCVVVLKMHPVNAYLGPLFERAFRSLIDAGYMSVVYGGVEAGEYLCTHPMIESIHLTGSDRTHDAIVWGPAADEQRARKAASDPVIKKPVTSELGCVTPVLVVPGAWTASDLEFQARHVAGMVAHNASFNCTAAKVLVTAGGWPQREDFLDRVRAALAEVPPRPAYYPGAQERYRRFLDHYPDAEVVGDRGNDAVPWTFVPGLTLEAGEYALGQEPFCGVLSEVPVDADDPDTFFRKGVSLCNEKIWGSLSCTVLIDGKTMRRSSATFQRAVGELRYGSVGVNAWSGVNFGLTCTTWGAFPGQPLEEIGSGRGVVHNGYLFDHPQKSVVYAPFRIWPKPVWFADHRTLDRVGRHLTRYAARGSMLDLLRVAWAGLGG